MSKITVERLKEVLTLDEEKGIFHWKISPANNIKVEVTHTENCRNVSKKSNNTSGYNGVIWHKSAKKWSAQIMVDRKNHYLGLFNTKEEALKARKEADIKYGFFSKHGN